jgi:hypothetical protein
MRAAPAKDKKTIIVVSIFSVLLLAFVVFAYNTFFGGSPNPAATPTPVSAPVAKHSNSSSARTENPPNNAKTGLGVAPGVAATMMASTSSSLDPTLDEAAMLRTESLVYSGTGRNIFSTTYTAPVELPKNVPSARPAAAPAPVPTGPPPPPPPPPINLKYFGTAVRANGLRQAFLLQGEDVYLASVGDIVARRYRIVNISPTNIQVEDLVYNDTQSIPLQAH